MTDSQISNAVGASIKIPNLTEATSALNTYNAAMYAGNQTHEEWFNTIGTNMPIFKNYIETVPKAEQSAQGYISAVKKAAIQQNVQTEALKAGTIASKGMAVATGVLNAALNMGIMMVATFAITKFVEAMDNAIHRSEKLIEAGKEAQSAINKLNDDFQSNSKTASELAERYGELASGVDKLSGKNLSLNDEDYEEFLSINQQLVEIFPELDRVYDSNGNAIVNLGNKAEESAKKIEELIEAQRQATLQDMADKLPEAFEGAAEEVKQLKTEFIKSGELDFSFVAGSEAEAIKIYDKYAKQLNKIGVTYRDLAREADEFGNVTVRFDIDEDSVGENLNEVYKIFNVDENALEQDRKITENKIKAAWGRTNSSLNAWLQTNIFQYNTMSDAMQSAMQQAVYNIDWNALNIDKWEDAQGWIEENLIPIFTSDGEANKLIEELFSVDRSELPYGDYIELVNKLINAVLSEAKGASPEIVKAMFGATDLTQDRKLFVNRVAGTLTKSGDNSNLEGRQIAREFYDSLNEEERGYADSNLFTEAVENRRQELGGLTLGIEDYLDILKEVEAKELSMKNSNPFSLSNLSAGTDSLKSITDLYEKVQSATEGGIFKGVDISEIESLRDALGDVDTEAFDELERILGNTSSTAEECKKAIEDYATSVVNAKIATGELDANDTELISSQIQLANVTKESADAWAQAAKTKAILSDNGLSLETVTYGEINALYREGVVTQETAQQLMLYALQKQAANLTLDTSADCANLSSLIHMLAATGLECGELKKMIDLLNGDEIMADSRRQTIINSVQSRINDIMKGKGLEVDLDIDTSKFNSGVKGAGDAAKDAAKDVDKLTDAYNNLYEIVQAYNENGEITIDQAEQLASMDLKWISLLSEEGNKMTINQAAVDGLTASKRELLKIQLYQNALDQINAIQNEADAMKLLAAATDEATGAQLGLLKAKVATALAGKASLLGEGGVEKIMQGLAAAEKMIDASVLKGKDGKDGKDDDSDDKKDDEKEDFEEEFNWIERLLERLSKWTQKIATTIENLYSFQKKNFYIDKEISSINREISAQKAAYDYYYAEAEKLGVSQDLKNKVKNGAVDIQIFNAENSTKDATTGLQKYIELYDAAMKARDAIDELYNSQRDLIRQKLDNVVEYYGEIDTYLSSITAKFESLISLNEAKGKKSSLVELVQEFGALQDAIATLESSSSSKEFSETTWGLNSEEAKDRVESAMGTSAEAIRDALTAQENAIKSVKTTGTYENLQAQQLKLAKNLAKKFKLDSDKNLTVDQKNSIYNSIVENGGVLTDEQISKLDAKQKTQYDKYITKVKQQYDTLQQQMNAIAAGATQDTARTYLDAYKKMQSFATKNGLTLDETGLLSDEAYNGLSEKLRKQYDKLKTPLETIKAQRASMLEEIRGTIDSIDNGTYEKTRADELKEEYDKESDNEEIKQSGAYKLAEQNINKTRTAIEKLVSQAAKKGLTLELDENGYIKNVEKLNDKKYASIKKSYEKQKKLLDNYYAEENALIENATIANVAEYDKIWKARQKLLDEYDSKGMLSSDKNQKLKMYESQLEAFNKERQSQLQNIQNQINLENAHGKTEQIEETYKQAVEGLNDSYNSQMNLLLSGVRETQQYKKIEGRIETLKQKQDKKGLSGKEEKELNSLIDKLAALDAGATSTNIKEYIKAYDDFIILQNKLDSNKKLSTTDAKKYDELKSKLNAWNKSKQEEIQMLIDQWQEGLQNLKKKRDEDLADAEKSLNEYYEKLWSTVKQIAEFGISNLQAAMDTIEGSISLLQSELDLYKKINKEQLVSLGYLNETDDINSRIEDDYISQIDLLNQKLDNYKNQKDIYNTLVDSLNSKDYAGTMDAMEEAIRSTVFDSNDEDSNKSIQDSLIETAKKARQMLEERAVESDDWDKYADEWKNEWMNALNSVSSEAINTVLEIQDLRDSFREWELSSINDAITQLESLKNALSSISSVINENWLFDDNGITEFGLAKVNLLSQQLTQAQSEIGKYAEIVNKIQETAADGSTSDSFASEKEKQEALNEAMQNYYNSLSSAYELENQIYEIAQKSQEEEINTLTELVNKYKEMLNAKKELANYRKDIEASQKTVESLEAQIKAIEGVNTAEANAKRAQLEAQLEDAKQQLEDKQDEHNYNNIVNALDDMLKDLEDALKNSADTIAETFEHFAETVKSLIGDSSGADVNSTMKKVTDLIMMDVSDAITKGISVGISESSTEASSGSYVKISDTNVSTMSDTLQKIYELSNKKLDTLNADIGSKMNDMISKLSDISGYANEINKGVSDINLNVESLITIDSMSLAGIQGDLTKYASMASEEALKTLSTQLKKLGINVKVK